MIPWRVRNQLRCFDMCWWMYFGQKTLENGTPKDTQTIQYPKYKPYLIHVCIFIVYLHIFVLLVQRCACVHAFYLREHSFWMLCDALIRAARCKRLMLFPSWHSTVQGTVSAGYLPFQAIPKTYSTQNDTQAIHQTIGFHFARHSPYNRLDVAFAASSCLLVWVVKLCGACVGAGTAAPKRPAVIVIVLARGSLIHFPSLGHIVQ